MACFKNLLRECLQYSLITVMYLYFTDSGKVLICEKLTRLTTMKYSRIILEVAYASNYKIIYMQGSVYLAHPMFRALAVFASWAGVICLL